MDAIEQAKQFVYENLPIAEKTLDDNPILYLPKQKNVPDCVREIRRKIIKDFKFENCVHNEDLDDFALHVGKGKSLPEHKDLLKKWNPFSYEHFRINWVVSASEDGGKIFSGSTTFDTNVGELYSIDGKELHGVTTVNGDTPLIVFSFGFIKRYVTHVL
jgi:hypothetical protein